MVWQCKNKSSVLYNTVQSGYLEPAGDQKKSIYGGLRK